MTVTVNTIRTTVEIRWSEGLDYEGQVQIFSVGKDGKTSNTGFQPNDGLAGLAYPNNFRGRSAIEIRKADGSGEVLDSGVIVIGDEDIEDGGEILRDDEKPVVDNTLP
jgi:hypothetical protein